MKRLGRVCLLGALVVASLAAHAEETDWGENATQPRVLVLDFEARSSVSADMARTVESLFTARARAGSHIRVAARREVEEILGIQAEQQLAGCDGDAGCLSRVGTSLAADWMVTGSVTRLADDFVLDLRLIEVADSRVARQVSERVTGDESKLAAAVEPAAALLLAPPLDAPLEAVRPKPAPPWYKRPLVWGGAGAVVAGGIAAFLIFRPASLEGELGSVTLDPAGLR